MPSKVIELPSETAIKDEYCSGYNKEKYPDKNNSPLFFQIYEGNSKKFSRDRLNMLLFYLGLYSDFADSSYTELIIDCELAHLCTKNILIKF